MSGRALMDAALDLAAVVLNSRGVEGLAAERSAMERAASRCRDLLAPGTLMLSHGQLGRPISALVLMVEQVVYFGEVCFPQTSALQAQARFVQQLLKEQLKGASL